ncbi:MAG: amidohydrolase [Acidobacteriota bacterium]
MSALKRAFVRTFRIATLALICGWVGAWIVGAHPGHHHGDKEDEPEIVELVNGHWFNGEDFVAKTFYIVSGTLTESKPPLIDRRVDLEGGWIVPPYGEAHNHNIVQLSHLEQKIREYLAAGVFYVKIANSVREYTSKIRDRLNQPDSLDVVFANGGITASNGHPVRLYEDRLRHHMYRGVERFWFNDRAYFIIENEADLETKWPKIQATPPDFIKTFLLYSEEFATRRDDPTYSGRKGLDPKLLPKIVAKAHAEGLRVSTHVETATDFRHALDAGTDEIAHLPGYKIPEQYDVSTFQISPADAKRAAERGTVVVTTTILAKLKTKDPERLALTQRNQVRNLRLLDTAGVPIAIGSDRFDLTSVDEALYLKEIDALDNLALLRHWCESTAQSIFPERPIGRLADGFEASFLVLGGNPIEDFQHVLDIRRGFKQGVELDYWHTASDPAAAD